MPLREFALLAVVCLLWASNGVVSKLAISHMGAPPLFFAAARFAVVTLVTLPWLLPAPKPLWRVILVGLCMGAGGMALMFIGLETASPSEATIVGQLQAPMATLLSVAFLGERIRWRRGLGIALTVVGVLIVMWRPEGLRASTGLIFVVGAALAGSVGAVLMKQIEGVRPLQFQAWVGFSSLWPLIILSALTETGQAAVLQHHGLGFATAVLFSALVVSVIAHTAYYGLIQRHEANLLQPLTLMTPLATIGLGVIFTHDRIDGRMALGAAIALLGVLIIALRPNRVMPLLLLIRNRAQ